MCLSANLKGDELSTHFKLSMADNNKDIQPHGH